MDSCSTYDGMLSGCRARVICGQRQEREEDEEAYRWQFIYYIAFGWRSEGKSVNGIRVQLSRRRRLLLTSN